jgi:hypothetical protein
VGRVNLEGLGRPWHGSYIGMNGRDNIGQSQKSRWRVRTGPFGLWFVDVFARLAKKNMLM